MLRILLYFYALCSLITSGTTFAASDQKANPVMTCFTSCIKAGGYPGACRDECQSRVKKEKQKRKERSHFDRRQQQELKRKERERQRQLKEFRKQQQAEQKIQEADASLEGDFSHVKLLCYRACYMKTQQKSYCEKNCRRPANESGDKINTGDPTIDQFIANCYRNCIMRDDATPSCFHQCCYICNKKNNYELSNKEKALFASCSNNCRLKGYSKEQCRKICSGE